MRDDDRPAVTIGARTFTQQYILARRMSDRLEARGFAVKRVGSLGSTVVFDALAASYIDACVDDSGTICAKAMKRRDGPGALRGLDEMDAWLDAEHGVSSLGPLGIEDASALSTDGRIIAAFDRVVLDDPERAFPPDDAVLLLSPEARRRPELVAALHTLAGHIDDDQMREANTGA